MLPRNVQFVQTVIYEKEQIRALIREGAIGD